VSEHVREVRVLTLATAKSMAAAAEAFALARGWTVAIGVSGMTSSQDGEVADAGLQALQV
jgi:uncharacterized protein GlcG (DUF336 family)